MDKYDERARAIAECALTLLLTHPRDDKRSHRDRVDATAAHLQDIFGAWPQQVATIAAPLAAELRAVAAEQREADARIADPRPGPEPRDFQAHRIRMDERRYIAAAIRAAKEE